MKKGLMKRDSSNLFGLKSKLFYVLQSYSFMIFKVIGDSNPTLAKYTPLA